MYYGERLNAYTHLLGAAAALAGMVVLVALAALQGDPWKIVSFIIYGLTLFLLYTISTLYHSFRGRLKEFFQILDYYAIYLLIAGTYTPFTLVTLRGPVGWTLFAIIWSLAVLGMFIETLPQVKARRILPLIIYLLMGWLVLATIKPLLETLPMAGFYWLLAGGLFYTIGVIFFILDDTTKLPHTHGIWHLFVLAGSGCQYWSIFYYVLIP